MYDPCQNYPTLLYAREKFFLSMQITEKLSFSWHRWRCKKQCLKRFTTWAIKIIELLEFSPFLSLCVLNWSWEKYKRTARKMRFVVWWVLWWEKTDWWMRNNYFLAILLSTATTCQKEFFKGKCEKNCDLMRQVFLIAFRAYKMDGWHAKNISLSH